MERPEAEGVPIGDSTAVDPDERPASLTWALRLLGVLVVFAGLVVLMMVLFNDDLVRAWAQGNPAARHVLDTQGLDALKHPSSDNKIRAPQFIAPAVTLYGVFIGIIWVLSVFLGNGFEWARISLTVLLLFTAVASVGGILTSPPVLFIALTLLAIAIGVAALVAMWLPATTRYIHPPAARVAESREHQHL